MKDGRREREGMWGWRVLGGAKKKKKEAQESRSAFSFVAYRNHML